MSSTAIEPSPQRRESPDARFQQAKSKARGRRFLQIAAKSANEPKAKPPAKLTRVAFKVSRLMEFCTRRELQNQTGHGVHDWPLVVLKELMDNALDASEESEVAPVISISVNSGSITIQDNAGGIATETISRSWTIRFEFRAVKLTCRRPGERRAMR